MILRDNISRAMRSYYAHLEQVKNKSLIGDTKPTFRASAIFPVIHRKGIQTRLLFLSYWFLKRHIKEITCLVTFRSQEGKILHRTIDKIDEPRSYRIELSEYLTTSGVGTDCNFIGSVEVEFFSSTPLVYPFPAVTVNYYGPDCSTFVHTAQRVYNDFEDMESNGLQKVAESGFNIRVDSITEPFIALLNGPIKNNQTSLDFVFINSDNEQMKHEFILAGLEPYETHLIYPSREVDLKGFLKGKAGTVKVTFDLPWVFPRLIVGNIREDPLSMSITHSYYDCSSSDKPSDYWILPEQGWHAAALSAPLQISDDKYTDIFFYPIYTPGKFTLDLFIYDQEGKLVHQQEKVFSTQSNSGQYVCLSMKKILDHSKIPGNQDLSLQLTARVKDVGQLPARIKLSIDIGKEKGLPCNICTNLVPFNADWNTKKNTFHWLPLLADQPICSVWLMNHSLKIEHIDEAQATLSFYREKDSKVITRKVRIPPNGFIVTHPEQDPELTAFLEGTVGWITVEADNPYLATYYFSENPTGSIGGDHGY